MTGARNFRVAGICVAVIAGMAGLTAASVPLYELFCKVTGYGGTPQRVAEEASETRDTIVHVYFNADTDPKLPWRFHPVQRSVDVKLGEERLVFYRATNAGTKPIVGTATFNVTPFKVGAHFAKLQCFCFENQVLAPGETVDMPVSFYVDPAILDDPDAKDVRQITLSYTFFLDEEDTAKLAARSVSEPAQGTAGPG